MSGRKADEPEVWQDNGVEIFLSSELGSQFIYQFIFNSAGAKCDLKNILHRIDPKYDSGLR